MDAVADFCLRVLGAGEGAVLAIGAARRASVPGTMERLAAAAEVCRGLGTPALPAAPAGDSLAAAVAFEMALAVFSVSEPEREALALRDGLGLDYAALSEVLGRPESELAPILAGARLAVRAARRGGAPVDGCEEAERTLALLARRADGELVADADRVWLAAHLEGCERCEQAELAMLEAAACYRAWRPGELVSDLAPYLEPAPEPGPLVAEPAAIAPAPEPAPPAALEPAPPAEVVAEPEPEVVAEPEPAPPAAPEPAPPAAVGSREPWYRRLREAIVEDTRR